MQKQCESCHYRLICAKGLTDDDPFCLYFRDEKSFGPAFDPAQYHKPEEKRNTI